jgi:hypothetical protein
MEMWVDPVVEHLKHSILVLVLLVVVAQLADYVH